MSEQNWQTVIARESYFDAIGVFPLRFMQSQIERVTQYLDSSGKQAIVDNIQVPTIKLTTKYLMSTGVDPS